MRGFQISRGRRRRRLVREEVPICAVPALRLQTRVQAHVPRHLVTERRVRRARRFLVRTSRIDFQAVVGQIAAALAHTVYPRQGRRVARTPGAAADVPERTTARKPPTIASVAANTTPVAAILPPCNPAIFIVVPHRTLRPRRGDPGRPRPW